MVPTRPTLLYPMDPANPRPLGTLQAGLTAT